MTGKCPILFENNQKKYQLTNQEIREFCKLGCSADCDIYLKEYVDELRKRKEWRILGKWDWLSSVNNDKNKRTDNCVKKICMENKSYLSNMR